MELVGRQLAAEVLQQQQLLLLESIEIKYQSTATVGLVCLTAYTVMHQPQQSRLSMRVVMSSSFNDDDQQQQQQQQRKDNNKLFSESFLVWSVPTTNNHGDATAVPTNPTPLPSKL